MREIILALGTNVGDKRKNLEKAINYLSEFLFIEKLSSIYLTKPVGEKNQDTFFNMVVKGKTSLSPFELLKFCKSIEKKVGRVYRYHWGPREMDIDIIFYGNLILSSQELTVPHPLMHKRDFVLIPLLEVDKDYIHPVLNLRIKDLLLWIDEVSILDKI